MQENAPILSLSNTFDLFDKLLAPISDYEPLITAISHPRDYADPEWVWKKRTSYKRTKKVISLKNFNQHSVDNIAVWERDESIERSG